MERTAEKRVLLADQPGPGRFALAALVSWTPGLALIAELSDPEEVQAALRVTRADVVVIDDRLLRDHALTADEVHARLFVIGVDDAPGYAARARRIGAEEWIAKELAASLLPLRLAGHGPGSVPTD